ncbi:MAG: hypothetical protein GKS04_04850 [Candidatus Mycalebacterium zealandia]|nr:MAG: hypothetical protein GKS04_04850 [Candidatus Mycalebacterium zealandia]
MSKSNYMFLSKLFFFGGIVSIVLSLSAWFFQGGMSGEIEVRASAERLGIFVGLWAPTMLALSTCLRHMGRDKS